MLGTRGVPAGDPLPRDLRDAGPRDPARRQGRATEPPQPEIMIPLVDYEHELEIMRELVAGRRRRGGPARSATDYTVGTMIELPRACFVADRIAALRRLLLASAPTTSPRPRSASRATTSSPSSSPTYLERKHHRPQPVRDDRQARRRLARAARRAGSAARPTRASSSAICGEHGGDPESIAFFHRAGLDYVSCSPYRVPIARIAAAQAVDRVSRSAAGTDRSGALRRRGPVAGRHRLLLRAREEKPGDHGGGGEDTPGSYLILYPSGYLLSVSTRTLAKNRILSIHFLLR